MSSKERSGYTVTMFIVDVSPSMGDLRTVQLPPGPNGEERTVEITNLEWSLKYLKLKIQEMIFNKRTTDKCGVVLIGTDATDNPVSDVKGGYDSVTLYIPIDHPTPRTLQKINKIRPETNVGDFIDGIIISSWLQEKFLESKPSWARKIVLITDGQNPLEIIEEDVDTLVAKLNQFNVDMTIIGIDFDDEEYGYEEPDKSTVKTKNEEFYAEFISRLNNGKLGTYAHALEDALSPDISSTRSMLTPNILSIGDVRNKEDECVCINIQLAKATARVAPKTLKKFSVKRKVEAEEGGEGGASQSQHNSQHQSQSQSHRQSQSQSQNPTAETNTTSNDNPGNQQIDMTLKEYSNAHLLEAQSDLVLRSLEEEYDKFNEEQRKTTRASQSRTERSKTKNAKDGTIAASQRSRFHTLVDKEDLVRAYKYGEKWVPVGDDSRIGEDGGVDQLKTVKGVEILGFGYESLWMRDWSMGEVYYIFGDKNIPRAQVAFSSFVKAMSGYTRKKERSEDAMDEDEEEEEPAPVLAIMRLVTKDNSPPKMGVALARSIETIDYLVWVQMPFAEDLRRFSFPSLDIIKTKDGKQKKEHPYLPDETMQNAMDALVTMSDLSQAGPKDEDGNRTPWYDPAEAASPAVHRLKEAMFHAAVVTDIENDPLPPPRPELTQFFERPKRVVTRSKKAAEDCKKVFKITKVAPRTAFKKKKLEEELAPNADTPLSLADLLGGDAFVSTWKTDWNPPPPPPPVPRSPTKSPQKTRKPLASQRRATLDEVNDEGSDTEDEREEAEDSMDIDQEHQLPPIHPSSSKKMNSDNMIVGEGSRAGRIIGNLHPLYDFEENTKTGDVVTLAVENMGEVIVEIVEESFSDQRFAEAIECMQAMRKMALEEQEVEEYNHFLRNFKRKLHKRSFKHPEFWGWIQREGIGLSLIYQDEGDSESDVSKEESKKFIEGN